MAESDRIWRLRVESDFGPDWRVEWEKDSKPRGAPSLGKKDEELSAPGQYKRVYIHLSKYYSAFAPSSTTYSEDYALLAMLFVGRSNSGKSSIVRKFVHDSFSESIESTVGAELASRYLVSKPGVRGSCALKLQIWDTDGGEKYRGTVVAWYRGVSAIMVVFDLNDAKSLLDTEKWYEDAIKVAVAPDVIVCLVGNKADQVDKRQVSEEHALTLANELGIPYFETSAKTGVDVDYIFTSVASLVVKKRNRLQATK